MADGSWFMGDEQRSKLKAESPEAHGLWNMADHG